MMIIKKNYKKIHKKIKMMKIYYKRIKNKKKIINYLLIINLKIFQIFLMMINCLNDLELLF